MRAEGEILGEGEMMTWKKLAVFVLLFAACSPVSLILFMMAFHVTGVITGMLLLFGAIALLGAPMIALAWMIEKEQ